MKYIKNVSSFALVNHNDDDFHHLAMIIGSVHIP